ncbi:MAG: DNA cytosine methyltransferase [Clostridium paraputrificum]
MRVKKIKKSNRGLTFSFSGEGTKFNIGNKYTYVLDKKTNKIYMLPSEDKKALKISRKKSGKTLKSLIDLRSKNIIDNFKDTDYIKVEIKKDIITVEALSNNSSDSINSCKNVIELTKHISKCKVVEKIRINKQIIDKAVGEYVYKAPETILRNLECDEYSYSGYSCTSLSEEELKGLESTIKVFSVFSGAGMLDYPLSKDGAFEIVKAIEYNRHACDSYRENIGDMIVEQDIRTFNLSEAPECDVLWGGTVCTVFSNENRKARHDKHKDNDLLQVYINMAKYIKNLKVFVLENVPEILSAKGGKYFNNLKSELSEYDISTCILKDSDLGGFTNRKRAFIIGSKIGKVSLDIPKKRPGTVLEALNKVDESWYNYNDYTKPSEGTRERMSYIPKGGNWRDLPKELWQPSYSLKKTHSNTLRRLELDKPCVALSNFRKTNLIHPTLNRGLSVAEALALSGFNNDFKLKGTLANKQLSVANGVPYKMGEFIVKTIKNIFLKYWYGNNVYCY